MAHREAVSRVEGMVPVSVPEGDRGAAALRLSSSKIQRALRDEVRTYIYSPSHDHDACGAAKKQEW